MSNVTPIKKRGESARPENIFLLTRCVEIFGILDAAILADLYYWIAQGKEPWRKAQEHADLFAVNEKTIRAHSKYLAEKHKCFGRRISMLKNGKQGACKYFPTKSENSKALKEQYYALFNNGFKKTDFGKFMAEEVIEVPKYITLPIAFIERLKNINLAYLLARLYWITFSENPDPVFRFRSQAKLARAMLLNRTTLLRYLNLLEDYKYLTHSDQANGIVISINTDSDLYEILSDWIVDNQEARVELIMESNY
ncbi:hypothetical protein Q4574_00845 [Aliiglaciecola sp. 3_MG-2023]|uniref:hypothetical protein n=1 Tax=Aliiglaciecola sp. 3_MG-2023 TaxID=3062644 RepID=UPI0026E2BC8A|nr:hypothetical protein [Aliiglaciecola sp. 3_MG-2023]MDO6691803.1 hypothetical protein [Aliiglaciecola sp. 3_MG-2023]